MCPWPGFLYYLTYLGFGFICVCRPIGHTDGPLCTMPACYCLKYFLIITFSKHENRKTKSKQILAEKWHVWFPIRKSNAALASILINIPDPANELIQGYFKNYRNVCWSRVWTKPFRTVVLQEPCLKPLLQGLKWVSDKGDMQNAQCWGYSRKPQV